MIYFPSHGSPRTNTNVTGMASSAETTTFLRIPYPSLKYPTLAFEDPSPTPSPS
jgi:hypothetical protein